jgi:hypothetical protein
MRISNEKGRIMTPIQINNLNELTSTLDWQEKRITSLEAEITEMKNAINDVASETKDNTHIIDDELPFTGLLSKNFLSRAFTVWGHFFVAQLIISFFVGIAYLIIFLVLLKSYVK